MNLAPPTQHSNVNSSSLNNKFNENSSKTLIEICKNNFCKRKKRRTKAEIEQDAINAQNAIAAKVKNTLLDNISRSAAAATRTSGPQVEIINGNIVVKESSLTVSQDAEIGEYEEIEEGLNPTATYSSFQNRSKTANWGMEETRTFYHALRQCGTDFSLMQAFFPNRTRKQLKFKFFR